MARLRVNRLVRDIHFQPFFVRETALFSELVEFRLVLEIRYGNLVVRQTAVSVDLACVVGVNACICNGD